MTRFRLEPGRSSVTVEAHSSLHPIHGRATGLAGYVEVVVDGGGIDVTGPVAGRVELRVEDLKSSNPLYDREMRRRADAARHPLIVGVLTSLVALGDAGRYRADGDLTFHGVTRHVAGEITAAIRGEELVIAGESGFDVRDFGIQPPRILMLRVHPEVVVRLDLHATAAVT